MKSDERQAFCGEKLDLMGLLGEGGHKRQPCLRVVSGAVS